MVDEPLRSAGRLPGVTWWCWPWSTPAEVIADGSIHVYAPLRGKGTGLW
jgi:hypothetical protein